MSQQYINALVKHFVTMKVAGLELDGFGAFLLHQQLLHFVFSLVNVAVVAIFDGGAEQATETLGIMMPPRDGADKVFLVLNKQLALFIGVEGVMEVGHRFPVQFDDGHRLVRLAGKGVCFSFVYQCWHAIGNEELADGVLPEGE